MPPPKQPLHHRTPIPDFWSKPHVPRKWHISSPPLLPLSSPSHLCATCQHISLPHLLFHTTLRDSMEEIPLPPLQQLLSLPNQEICALCRIVKRTLLHSHGATKVEEVATRAPETKVLISAFPRNLWACQVEPWVLRISLKPFPEGWEGNAGRAVHFLGEEGVDYGEEGEVGRKMNGMGLRLGEQADLIRAAIWIGRCCAGGGICGAGNGVDSKDEGRKGGLPKRFRLIDAADFCVVPADDTKTYYALSYVWGEKKDWLELKEENEAELSEKGSLMRNKAKIPLSIRDAIWLVPRLLGRYLWVDALCIVQDRPDEVEEQIAGMRAIYGCARATIAAAAGTDADYGLPGVGRRKRDHDSVVEVVQGLQLACKPFDLSEAVDESRWNTRGWTYQERLLSPRVLFFTAEQMFFKCAHMEDPLTEDAVGSGVKRNNSVHPTNDGGRDLLHREHSINTLLYEQSVAAYSKRNLTEASDMLNAFAGVSEHMSVLFRSRIAFGLPENELSHALLWDPKGSCTRRLDDKKKAIFPSWSWCGWTANVLYHHTCRLLLSRIVFVDDTGGLATEERLRQPSQRNAGLDPWWKEEWTETITNATRTHYFEKSSPSRWYAHPVAPVNARRQVPSLTSKDGRLRFWAQTVDLSVKGYKPPDKIESPKWWFPLSGKDGLNIVGGWMTIPSHFLRRLGEMKLTLVRIARSRSSSEPEDNGWEEKLREEMGVLERTEPTSDDPLVGMHDEHDVNVKRSFFPERDAYTSRRYTIDEQRFDMKKPFCLNQLLLVEWLDDGTARRVGRATAHIDFWAQEAPVEKLIVLG